MNTRESGMSDAEKLREAVAAYLCCGPEGCEAHKVPKGTGMCVKSVDHETDGVIAAIDAAGFAVVPKVATEAMLIAADEERNGWRRQPSSVHGYAWIYAAMLVAAPKVLS